VQQLHGCHALANFFGHYRFLMKLFRKLDRKHRAGSWPAFSSPLLAILPDCMKMQFGFLLSTCIQALQG
jgi:hypothetical protein